MRSHSIGQALPVESGDFPHVLTGLLHCPQRQAERQLVVRLQEVAQISQGWVSDLLEPMELRPDWERVPQVKPTLKVQPVSSQI